MDKSKDVTKAHLDELPIRGVKKYTRIENYEDYEFTHCIAYEMAIRNKEVIKLTNIVEKLNLLNLNIFRNSNSSNSIEEVEKYFQNLVNYIKESIPDIINSTKSIVNVKDTINQAIIKNLDQKDIDILNNSFIRIIDEYEESYLSDIIHSYNNTNIEPLILEYKENNLKNLFIKASLLNKYNLILLLLISVESKLGKEFYVVNEKKAITPEHIEEFISKDTNYEPNREINNHIHSALNDPNYVENYIEEKGYTVFQGSYKGDDNFNVNKVSPNFSQPLRMFNSMEISINPSLPLNDILSFVKKIKEDYDQKSSFKSFFQLINEDLNIIPNKTTLEKEIKFDKSKWADLFYIYDYFKFYKNKTIYDIAEELSLQLTFYYNLKNSKPIPENLTNAKLDFEKYTYNKSIDFGDTLYANPDQIRKIYYKRLSALIEGNDPEYKKLVGGKNHKLNSFIEGKNNSSKKL